MKQVFVKLNSFVRTFAYTNQNTFYTTLVTDDANCMDSVLQTIYVGILCALVAAVRPELSVIK